MDLYISGSVASQTTTPEQVDKKKFMNKSTSNKFSELYDEIEELKRIVADLTERLGALEAQETPEPTPDPEPDPEPEPTEPIIYTFESFGDSEGTIEYGTGTVETTNTVIDNYTEVIVLSNSYDENLPEDQKFVNKLFYVVSNASPDNETLYQLYVNTDGNLTPIDVWVKIKEVTGGGSSDVDLHRGV